MKRNELHRSADIARFRLGVHCAAPLFFAQDNNVRRMRYEARRDLHDHHGEASPLELWRAS
ncbi:hypothetical protein [Halomonas sp. WWR20]